jgi:Dockerin type I domain/Metallo-peptidase family M12B Reprolysin-like
VTGKLSGYVNGVLLGTVPPFNPGGQITAPYNPDWMQINDTLNFELPYAWTEQPTLRLEVEVNPDHTVTELNYENNKRSTLMTFLPCSGVSVQYMLLDYDLPGFAPAYPSANTAAGQEFMRKIFPIPDKGLAYFPRETMTLSDDINAAGNDDALLAFLSRLLLSSSAPRAEHIYAWLPQSAYSDNGLGYKPGVAAFGNDTENQERWRRTFAHEIGHNYGFDHVDSTTAGAHWFDVYDRVIKPVPATVGGADLLDVMVPERLEPEAWISRQSYESLVAVYFGTSAAPPLLTNTTTTSASIQTTPGTQYFWQLVSKNSSGSTWGPAWTFTTVTAAGDANGDGTVSVADVFYLINNLFAGGPSPVGSGDANGDGSVSVADVFYLINYLFSGGPAPH